MVSRQWRTVPVSLRLLIYSFWSQYDELLLQIVLDADRLSKFTRTSGHGRHRKGEQLLILPSRVPRCSVAGYRTALRNHG